MAHDFDARTLPHSIQDVLLLRKLGHLQCTIRWKGFGLCQFRSVGIRCPFEESQVHFCGKLVGARQLRIALFLCCSMERSQTSESHQESRRQHAGFGVGSYLQTLLCQQYLLMGFCHLQGLYILRGLQKSRQWCLSLLFDA